MATNSFNLLSDAVVAPPSSFNLLSDAVIVPPNSFNLLSDALILPASAFALTSDARVGDPAVVGTKYFVLTSDAMVALFEPSHPKRKPQIEEPPEGCVGCGAVIDCQDTGPYDLYSLEGLPFSVILNCPINADCLHGDEIRIICCQQELIAKIPANATADERIKLIQDLLYECARRESFCQGGECPPGIDCGGGGGDNNCPPGVNCNDPCALFIVPRPPNCGPLQLYYNRPQTCVVKCPDGNTFRYTIKGGVFIGLSQIIADRLARNRACQLANEHRICLAKASKSGCADEELSMRIYASGAINNNGVPTLFWDVDNSDLPPGMTLVPVSFKPYADVTGTPTTPGTYTFSVTATNAFTGDTQTRSYTITINDCPSNLGNITPDIFSAEISYWNDGDSLAAGDYMVRYIEGAMGYGPIGKWYVNADPTPTINGYFIKHGPTLLAFPSAVFPNAPYGDFPSEAAVAAAYAGISISFHHLGGKIGMRLHDNPYDDNIAGSPNPTFKLTRL